MAAVDNHVAKQHLAVCSLGVFVNFCVKKSRALNETPSQSYGMSLAIWDHTCHPMQVNTPRLNPCQTSRYSIFAYPSGMEG